MSILYFRHINTAITLELMSEFIRDLAYTNFLFHNNRTNMGSGSRGWLKSDFHQKMNNFQLSQPEQYFRQVSQIVTLRTHIQEIIR